MASAIALLSGSNDCIAIDIGSLVIEVGIRLL
jgi:hypothetical protein